MESRDQALDLIKGIACILMIFSHAAIDTKNAFILGLGFLGSFAAVLFFSVTGITAKMQADRRLPKEILPPYMILLLAGFSLNGIIQIDFYKNFEVEMLQIIAIGAALVYLIDYLFHPDNFIFLMIGLIIFVIKLSLGLMLNNIQISHSFIQYWFQGWLLPPGTFTIIPWLFVFFLGVYAYRAYARINLLLSCLSIFSILGILLITKNPSQLDMVNKWDMSVGYFLFSCFFLFFSYYLAKRFIIRHENILSRLILFLGKNSLLFLYVHIFVINVFYRLGFSKLIWLYWPLILITTCLLIYIVLFLYPKTNLSNFFHYKITWMILIACIMLTPLLLDDIRLIFLLEFIWGVCFSTNYSESKKLFRNKLPTFIENPQEATGA